MVCQPGSTGSGTSLNQDQGGGLFCVRMIGFEWLLLLVDFCVLITHQAVPDKSLRMRKPQALYKNSEADFIESSFLTFFDIGTLPQIPKDERCEI